MAEQGRKGGQERWSGRAGFLLATIGSAVGIGSIWKFPYEAGANGGGAFVAAYGLGLVLIALPVMLAEFVIGRRGRADAAESMARAAQAASASRHWAWVGSAGIAAGLLILSFYSVIGGWTLLYLADSLFAPLPIESGAARAQYEAMLASPLRMALAHALFIAACGTVVAFGIGAGIEVAARTLMPLLFVLLFGLAAHALLTGDARAALTFLFRVDLAALTPRAVFDAVGLGFFSIGVGLGLMITFAAYADDTISLTEIAVATLVADTVISLVAGLAIFPIVFAAGLDPASGPGLMFLTLPIAFSRMSGGAFVAAAFYLLLFVAALASAVSLLELGVAFLQRKFGLTRRRASIWLALTLWFGGLASVLSFNHLAGWHPLPFGPFRGATLYEIIDTLTSDIVLPLCGLALAIFAGYVLPQATSVKELALGPIGARLQTSALRFIAPTAIVAIMLAAFIEWR